jgi:hypothetical protein
MIGLVTSKSCSIGGDRIPVNQTDVKMTIINDFINTFRMILKIYGILV